VSRTASIDLHGHSADEAVSALEAFVNDAILDGHSELRVIHGRTGGRVKSAVHIYLRRLSRVASFHLDPRNPGVTIVKFA
jgi:DNA mismatch repair protein MutS2